MLPLRSPLFVPGNRPEMLQKAARLPADALVVDLEDSVPLAEKGVAREVVARSLSELAVPGRPVIVRVNGLETGLLREDLEGVVGPQLWGVTVGKLEEPWQVREVSRLLELVERSRGIRPGTLRLVVLLEVARGVVNAYAIARASPRVAALAFGAEDLSLDLGIQRTASLEGLAYPRAHIALAARAAGVQALDTPYPNLQDEAGLRQETAQARALGYHGKLAIHPAQLQAINELFTPSPQEVDWARRVVVAFEVAGAQGRGVTAVEGVMVDLPAARRARQLLELYDALAQRERA